jgi:hypothetical protein
MSVQSVVAITDMNSNLEYNQFCNTYKFILNNNISRFGLNSSLFIDKKKLLRHARISRKPEEGSQSLGFWNLNITTFEIKDKTIGK